ncbi:MAG TPA: FAD-linked oxidase C-terminal domain-containing protein [Candidatus Baltobacteraceae bacterium]|jgi:glycolate oxidase|nr:FAD-linked oxidase C-terminal domain-containing protein [Candidatus Baltobacteraceae bacterium]
MSRRQPSADLSVLNAGLAAIVGARNVVMDAAGLRTYECDGLAGIRVRPPAVALPESTEQVAKLVKFARGLGMPIVPRGAGTGLSGGALPDETSLVIGLSRMTAILDVDVSNRCAQAQSGVTNLDLGRRLWPHGYYYAPDPSSQAVCTIGGNVAENAGGMHCLKYGFTTNHVLAATLVMEDGEICRIGSPAPDSPGYDLLGVLVGSEGMLGIVTEVTVRILRIPQTTRTFFATFASIEEAGDCVSLIVAAGIVPAAIEMMDRLAIEAIVAATGVDWPLDVNAALLVDVDGVRAEVEYVLAGAIGIASSCGALKVRVPNDELERQLMWQGRKSAFAAMGRISPNYFVQDGVIPRSAIHVVLHEISALCASEGLRVANVFHAGDGNLHPLVLYDARVPGEEARAEHLSGEILRICLRYGGSITGEHGVGADKKRFMAEMFNEDDLETMNYVRCAFDPERLFNPNKVFPTPRLCGDRPGPYRPQESELSGVAERV